MPVLSGLSVRKDHKKVFFVFIIGVVLLTTIMGAKFWPGLSVQPTDTDQSMFYSVEATGDSSAALVMTDALRQAREFAQERHITIIAFSTALSQYRSKFTAVVTIRTLPKDTLDQHAQTGH